MMACYQTLRFISVSGLSHANLFNRLYFLLVSKFRVSFRIFVVGGKHDNCRIKGGGGEDGSNVF